MLHNITTKLFYWITSLMHTVPPKSKLTLMELIVGAMVSASGHVTEAILAIKTDCNWTTYYKMIETGKFKWVTITKNLTLMLAEIFSSHRIILAVDDTLVPRSSEKAPGVDIHFDHAKRKNEERFKLSQLFVSLFLIARDISEKSHALPLCMMLSPKDGSSSKLRIALFLLRTTWRWLVHQRRKIILLCDSWYMKNTLILPGLEKNIDFIGQVRRDTALYLPPKPHSGRGRPRKYGAKIPKESFQDMAALQSAELFAYGKNRLFEFYEFLSLAKFLNGKLCKAIWCRFNTDGNNFTNWHLIISTDTNLTSKEILSFYAARWSVEPAFNTLKNSVGVNRAWQQSKKAFDRWRCILCCAYCLSVLSAMFFGNDLQAMFKIPWRQKQPMTAPWAARALRIFFGNVSIRACWDRKRQKLIPPS